MNRPIFLDHKLKGPYDKYEKPHKNIVWVLIQMAKKLCRLMHFIIKLYIGLLKYWSKNKVIYYQVNNLYISQPIDIFIFLNL